MPRLARLALYGLLGGTAAAIPMIPAPASAQQPVAGPDGVEVLARGPVHEAFAATAEAPIAGPLIQQLQPNPIEELPPDEKPQGDNVQWISGYWHFEDEKRDFIWISGFWRVPPPGRVWLPGSWREVQGGRQWTHGFWQEVAPVQAQQVAQVAQELEYLPPPPQPLELAPSVPQPDVTSFFVPGSWVWRGHYVWRPGYWVTHRPDWVWVPAHFRYTPGGCLFVEGYWDYPLERRGVLFAPVYFPPVIVNRPTFVYTPTYAVSHQGLVGALFVRRGFSSYYFGDYFEQRYTTLGFDAWCGSPRGTGFALNINIGRGPRFDPLWNHYQIQHRAEPLVVNNIQNVYVGRFNGEVARPPRTLVQQTTVVNNITNVTNTTVNNTTVNNVNNSVTNLTMVQPLNTVQRTNTNVVLRPVPQAERVKEQQLVKQSREVGAERNRAETQLAAKQLAPTQASDKPRQVKLDLPQQVVARAQAPEKPQFVLPPRPTARQADQNAKTPATIPPATDVTAKPTPAAPTPAAPVAPSVKEMPTKPLPTPTAVAPTPTPADPKRPKAEGVKPTPPAPTTLTPTPVAPLPMPVKPEVKPTPVTPTPMNPMPTTELNPKRPKAEGVKPLPTLTPAPVAPVPTPAMPAKPEVKPVTPASPTPVVPQPTPAKPLPTTEVNPKRPKAEGTKPLPLPTTTVTPLPTPTPVTPTPTPKSEGNPKRPKAEGANPLPTPVTPVNPTPVTPTPANPLPTPANPKPVVKPVAPANPVTLPANPTPLKPLPAPLPVTPEVKPLPVNPAPVPPRLGVPPAPGVKTPPATTPSTPRRDPKDPKDKDAKDKNAKDGKEPKDRKDPKDAKEPRDPKEPRESTDPKKPA